MHPFLKYIKQQLCVLLLENKNFATRCVANRPPGANIEGSGPPCPHVTCFARCVVAGDLCELFGARNNTSRQTPYFRRFPTFHHWLNHVSELHEGSFQRQFSANEDHQNLLRSHSELNLKSVQTIRWMKWGFHYPRHPLQLHLCCYYLFHFVK